MMKNLIIVKLHHNREYFQECCDLLNEFWPRSQTARLHSLNKSNDLYPCSYVMISSDDKVIGHVSVNVKYNSKQQKTAYIESLIIKKEYRRKGLGRYMINELEKILVRDQFKIMALKTIDQVSFYERIGFKLKATTRSLVIGQIRKKVKEMTNAQILMETNQDKDNDSKHNKFVDKLGYQKTSGSTDENLKSKIENLKIKEIEANGQMSNVPEPPPLPIENQSNHVIEYLMEKILQI